MNTVPGMPAKDRSELGADTAPGLSVWRRVRAHLLARRHCTVEDERERYERLGLIGPVYEFNSRLLQLALMRRIRELRGLPPLPTTPEAHP